MEQALTDLLLGTSAITDLIGDRLTPGILTQGALLPALVMNVFPIESGYSHQGDDGLLRARVQLDAYAATYVEAKAVGEAVRGLLSGFSGLVGTEHLTILNARAETGFDHNSPGQTHRRSMDFTVWSRATSDI